MLRQVIGDLLPAAIAVALSPFPIVAIVIVLGAPRARTAGSAFALGWILGLSAVSTLVVAVAGPSSTAIDTGVNSMKVGVGLLFFGLAFRTWRKRPRNDQTAEPPKWMASMDHVTPSRALVFGLALSAANPKNLALVLTAAGSIAQAGLGTADEAIAIAVFVVLGSVPVAGAVLAYLVAPEAARGPLERIKQFMADNNPAIMIVVFVLLGAKVLGDGLGGFGS